MFKSISCQEGKDLVQERDVLSSHRADMVTLEVVATLTDRGEQHRDLVITVHYISGQECCLCSPTGHNCETSYLRLK